VIDASATARILDDDAPIIDLDVDANNDGEIDPDNGPDGTDDPIEMEEPSQIIGANSDDGRAKGTGPFFDGVFCDAIPS
jgi:hypothetical protein